MSLRVLRVIALCAMGFVLVSVSTASARPTIVRPAHKKAGYKSWGQYFHQGLRSYKYGKASVAADYVKGPYTRKQRVQIAHDRLHRRVTRPAEAQAGNKKASGNWSRGPQRVTIDTRGINAGTPEGRAALTAASNLFRDSRILGTTTSPGQARSFNARARSVAKQVNSVSSTHRAQAAERARSDAYVRSLVAARARR